MDFSNVVCVITGASKGIGKTLATILSEYNAKVIGVYNKTKSNNVNFDTYKCDISSEKNVKRLFKYVQENYHSVDILVNCAALCLDDDMDKKSGESFLNVLAVNLVGTFLMCKYASKFMKKGSSIINISSTDAQDTFSPLSMDYAASKAGVENLTKNLAKILHGIKVCALAPVWVDTETVLEMDPNYLKEQMENNNQLELLRKEDVAMKIIEIIINDDDYSSGDIIRMEKNYE